MLVKCLWIIVIQLTIKKPFFHFSRIHFSKRDGLPLILEQNTSPQRFAMFKTPEGESVMVDLYPDGQLLGSVINPEKVGFYLYTKKNVKNSTRIYKDEKDALLKAGFNPKYKTKFIVHGFLNNLNSDTIQTIKNNLLTSDPGEYNVIAVDWSTYTLIYIDVNNKSKEIGEVIGKFIEFLLTVGVSLEDIHCIGHSLGAHACGFAGSSLKSGKISRISGLDPALPGFDVTDLDARLDSTDAQFVDCIHTCGGFLGIDDPICSADFYPNKGKYQPGCHWYDFGSCSHGRSHEFYAESILKEHLFPAFNCNSTQFLPENCIFKGALMGYPAIDKYTGILYTETNSYYPYAKNWNKLNFLNSQ